MTKKYYNKLQGAVKRILDVSVALIVLSVFLPIWGVIAMLIKMTSPGPVIFIQERPGKHKAIFKIFKFRTMMLGSEKMVKGQEVTLNDERITSVGRFLRRSKLDEIPQMLNILKDEMSLVGPRPERISDLEDYTAETGRRLNVKPGLTGLAQVSGNIYIPLEERYKLDVYYVDHFSLWLDMRIIFRTLGVVLRGEDKYVDMCLIDIHGAVTIEDEIRE